jgi:hypothetical protein
METQLADFVSAGFFVTREVDRPSYVSTDLLPDRIVSASACIAPFIPDTWCIEWTQDSPDCRADDAKAFALDSGALGKVTAWVTPRFGKTIGWPNVLKDINSAKDLVDLFLSSLPDVKVLELGLHRSMTAEFSREAEPPPQKPGFGPTGRQGVHEVILQGNPPAQGGNILGFEPLVFDGSLSCSWLCNSLDTVVEQVLGIRPSQYGLIGAFDDARRCVAYISRDEVGAEPGLWLPWLIIDHTQRVLQDRSRVRGEPHR